MNDHYKQHNGFETVDFLEEVIDCMDFDEAKDAWCIGCALKYALRAGKKGDWKEDARKCADFLTRYKHGCWTEENEADSVRAPFSFKDAGTVREFHFAVTGIEGVEE